MTTQAVSVTPRIVKDEGDAAFPIWIVGEYPSAEDTARGRPFAGTSGDELSRMLHDAGILRTECHLTLVAPVAPRKGDIEHFFTKRTAKNVIPSPELSEWIIDLHTKIARDQPKVIIALGELALYALTENSGITKWRGSIIPLGNATVIPTYAPSKIMREWSWRYIAVHDMRKAAAFARGEGPPAPLYNFVTRPSFEVAIQGLANISTLADAGTLRVALDIETRAGHIACVGFAWTTTDALCVPFMCTERTDGYWTLEEEQAIVIECVKLFRHPNIKWVLQNGLYDLQYFARFWGAVPKVAIDTMLAHHVCFSGLPKSLDFLSSLYCSYHTYWKDENKDWSVLMNEDQLWSYNCKDAVITLEVSLALDKSLDAYNLREQFTFQMLQFESVFRMMLRGVRQDLNRKGKFNLELMEAEAVRQEWLNAVIGRPFNVRSPKQMQEFCYHEMGLPPQRNRKTGALSCDDKSLEKLARREPIFRPIYQRISELRSLGVFRATFVQMRLDHDGRVRCSYNVAGTETFRYSSSEDAFGFGGNLQNIPAGDEGVGLPNVRTLFLPDPGYTIFDCDLDRADAQVVAWEANDEILKSIFHAGEDMHLQNAKDIFNNPRLTKDSKERKLAKAGVHACVDGEHEALTPYGWVKVSEIPDHLPILVATAEGLGAHFEPVVWNRQLTTTKMVELSGQQLSQFVTWDHTIPTHKGFRQAHTLTPSDRIRRTVHYSTRGNHDPLFARLLQAFHADGTVTKNQVRFHFKKERKIQRLTKLLTDMGQSVDIRYYSDNTYNIIISGVLAQALISWGKTPQWNLLSLGQTLRDYVDEMIHWDGHIGETSASVTNKNRQTIEIYQTLQALCGYGGNISRQSGVWKLQRNARNFSRITTTSVENWKGQVYCPYTSTGFWLTRRNGSISLTGNTNYGAKPPTLSRTLGISMIEAERFYNRWFAIHPAIADWHRRIEDQLVTTRCVSNKFGYRRYYFDRVENLLPEALAWVPQSTVALVIDKGLVNVDTQLRGDVDVLLQVHDSLVMQCRTKDFDRLMPRVKECLRITIPYDDPLVIGVGMKASEVSWGDCEDRGW